MTDRDRVRAAIHQVDAFSGRLFAGNPAAVVLLDDWLADPVLQAIAAENNLAETAFVVRRGERVALRWFTPAVEVDLCGHATLAAAFVLFEYHVPHWPEIAFETRSGVLTVRREGDGLTLDFPSMPAVAVGVTDAMASAIGVRPAEALQARDLVLVLESERLVGDLQPDFGRIVALGVFAVVVTAPGREVDFVSRFFAPAAGIPEDPVTGSAHCTLAPYWAARLGRRRLTARQISPRGGDLLCELQGDRVLISGRCTEYLRGEILLPR